MLVSNSCCVSRGNSLMMLMMMTTTVTTLVAGAGAGVGALAWCWGCRHRRCRHQYHHCYDQYRRLYC